MESRFKQQQKKKKSQTRGTFSQCFINRNTNRNHFFVWQISFYKEKKADVSQKYSVLIHFGRWLTTDIWISVFYSFVSRMAFMSPHKKSIITSSPKVFNIFFNLFTLPARIPKKLSGEITNVKLNALILCVCVCAHVSCVFALIEVTTDAFWPVHLARSQSCGWNPRVKQIKKPSHNGSMVVVVITKLSHGGGASLCMYVRRKFKCHTSRWGILTLLFFPPSHFIVPSRRYLEVRTNRRLGCVPRCSQQCSQQKQQENRDSK